MSLGTKDNAGKLSYTELGSFFENMAMMVKSGISVPDMVNVPSSDRFHVISA